MCRTRISILFGSFQFDIVSRCMGLFCFGLPVPEMPALNRAPTEKRDPVSAQDYWEQAGTNTTKSWCFLGMHRPTDPGTWKEGRSIKLNDFRTSIQHSGILHPQDVFQKHVFRCQRADCPPSVGCMFEGEFIPPFGFCSCLYPAPLLLTDCK